MLTRLLLLVILLVSSLPTFAQKEWNVWCFGQAKADFKRRPVDSQGGIYRAPDDFSRLTNISDADGNLLFYASTQYVYNRLGQVMPNGALSTLPTGEANSGIAIVPIPNSQKYYVFGMTGLGLSTGVDPFSDAYLHYVVVDMKANNGLGAVLSGSTRAVPQPIGFNRLVVIRHQNAKDYWLLVRTYHSRSFLSFPITAAGLGPSIASLEQQGPYLDGASGFASPDGRTVAWFGTTLVSANPDGTGVGQSSLSLYTFDPATGRVSQPRLVRQFAPHRVLVTDGKPLFSGNSLGFVSRGKQLCFSPNSRVLYSVEDSLNDIIRPSRTDLYQYDLSQPTPEQIGRSRLLLTTMPSLPILFPPGGVPQDSLVYFQNPRLAPDSTIWVADAQDWRLNTYDGTPVKMAAAAILQPNVVGPGCLFRRRAHWYARSVEGGAFPNIIANTLFAPPSLHYAQTCPGDTVQFWAGSPGGTQPRWDFGDPTSGAANTATGPFASHYYARAGTYPVRLTLPDGRQLTQPLTVEQGAGTEQTRANIFTPNGDGLNDTFEPVRGAGLTRPHLRVFSRWGRLVYETWEPAARWDGAGTAAGVYFYQLEYQDCRQQVRLLKGTVTLAR